MNRGSDLMPSGITSILSNRSKGVYSCVTLSLTGLRWEFLVPLQMLYSSGASSMVFFPTVIRRWKRCSGSLKGKFLLSALFYSSRVCFQGCLQGLHRFCQVFFLQYIGNPHLLFTQSGC